MSHTPGPWATDVLEHDEPHQPVKIKRGERTICVVWIDDAPVHDYNREQYSNARLIAAAPQLLKELKHAEDEIDRIASFLVGYGDAAEIAASQLRKLSQRLQPTIAAATGE